MIRTVVLLLTALGQLAASAVPGVFILCLHQDGHAAVELAWSSCCHSDETADAKCLDVHRDRTKADSHGVGAVGGLVSACGHCTDYALVAAGNLIGPGADKRIAIDDSSNLLAGVASPDHLLSATPRPCPERRLYSPSAPEFTSYLSTVILRC
ncbi:MAG TPA: hypothetical protein VFA18_19110 [Gemmataceae bacterium]|nr:hypothetical protein [Gemmataceae bacterium]